MTSRVESQCWKQGVVIRSTKLQGCRLLSTSAASQSHIPLPTALSSPSAVIPQRSFPSVLLFHGLWPSAKVIQIMVEVERGRSCAPETCCQLWEGRYIPLFPGGRTTKMIIIINKKIRIINSKNVKNPTAFSLRIFFFFPSILTGGKRISSGGVESPFLSLSTGVPEQL